MCFQDNKKKKEIIVKFGDSQSLRSSDTERIVTPEKGPKSFGTSEKRARETLSVLLRNEPLQDAYVHRKTEVGVSKRVCYNKRRRGREILHDLRDREKQQVEIQICLSGTRGR